MVGERRRRGVHATVKGRFSFIHNLCIMLWIVTWFTTGSIDRATVAGLDTGHVGGSNHLHSRDYGQSVPGAVDPAAEGRRQGRGQARWTARPRLAGPTSISTAGIRVSRRSGNDMPRTPASSTPSAAGHAVGPARPGAAPGRLVVGTRPERRLARGGGRVEPEPDEDVDSPGVRLRAWTESSGWCSSVTAVPPDLQAPAEARRSRCPGPRSRRPPLAPTQGGWRVPQRGPRPHRRDQLGVVLPALESQQLVEGRPADDAVGRQAGVALELAERRRWRRRRCRRPGRVEARLHRRCCSSATSSPRSIGVRR